jgi:hypothetical protein
VAVVSSCCSVAALLVEVAVNWNIVIVVLGRLGDDWNEVSCSRCFVLFEVQQRYELSVLHIEIEQALRHQLL